MTFLANLFLMKKMIILRKIQLESAYKKKLVVMKAMREKLNVSRFSCRFNIYELKIWIGANAGIAKTKREKIDCLCCILVTSAKILEREGSISLSNFYGHLPGY